MGRIVFINSCSNPDGNTAKTAAPEQWMLEACNSSFGRFSRVCGCSYKGMVTGVAKAQEAKF